jgi:probable outer membrane receptor protein
MLLNFKATKQFGKHLSLSFFADRVFYIAPDYSVNGFIVRRTFSPYFGMEVGLKI